MKKLLVAPALFLILFVGRAFGQAHDPWIDRAFREAIGRAPQGNEWNVQNYGHGHWSSYDDLLAKVRCRACGQGVAYIFIKPEQAVKQGHISWGFMMDDGSYCFGSTENPLKPMPNFAEGVASVWQALNIGPGADNGFWCGFADTEADMLTAMRTAANDRTSSAAYPYGNRCSGYWHFKKTFTPSRYAGAARAAAEHDRVSGFIGLTWNCLDQAYAVLEAYGVDKSIIMPWKQTHPSPNYWFNDFGSWDAHTGRYAKGNNTSGFPL